MEMNIQLFGLESIERNDMLFAESEMRVVGYVAEDIFIDLIRASGSTSFAEAEGSSAKSNNIFSKIWNMFKSLIKGIISFIKKVAKETVRLLLLPFSSKQKMAEGGSVAGSPTARGSSEATKENPMGTKYGNVKEITRIQKDIIKYMYTKEPRGVKFENVLNNGFINNDKFDKINVDRIYKISDFDDILSKATTLSREMSSHIARIAKMEDPMSDLGEVSNFVKLTQEKNLKNHEVLYGSFDIISKNKVPDIQSTVVVYAGLGKYIADIIEYCKYMNEMSEKIIGTENVDLKSKSYISSYMKSAKVPNNEALSNDRGLNYYVISAEQSNIQNEKIFGKPADEIFSIGKLLVLASSPDINTILDKGVMDSYLKKHDRSKYNINSLAGYKDTLSNKIYDKEVSSLFKSVSIGQNLKDVFKSDNDTNAVFTSMERLLSSVKILTDLNEQFYGVPDGAEKSGAQDVTSKIDTSVQADAKNATAWKSLLTGCAKIIRNLGNQTIALCSDVRYLYNTIQSIPMMALTLNHGNKALYTYDYLCYLLSELSSLLNDKGFTDKVFGGSEDEITSAKERIDKIFTTLKRDMEDTFKVKA